MSILDTYTPPPNPGDTLRRVLLIKLGALGDFMQALGAMRVVRATHPSARITLLTTEPFEAFAKACPYFDIVEADGRPRDIKGRTDLIRRLRTANYDMVYDFQNNDRTAQYFVGLTGKKPFWSGADKGASHQHINPERAEMLGYDVRRYQLLGFALGGALAGLSGVLYTAWGQYITPSSMGITAAALPVIWVAFGGRKDVTATLIGTLMMIFLYQWLTIYGSQYAIVVMGVILVLTVLFAPEGMVLSLMRWISARLKPAGGRR